MATWHQNQRPVRLWHDTKWTVVTDPLHGLRTSMLFDTEKAAQTFMDNLKKNNPEEVRVSYILPPHNGES